MFVIPTGIKTEVQFKGHSFTVNSTLSIDVGEIYRID